jgi:hypothetical protein
LTGVFTLIGVNPVRPSQGANPHKENPMRSKPIAIAASIAALSLAAAPAAALASGQHGSSDRSRDVHGIKHVDKTRDLSSFDSSRDIRDR